MRDLRFLIGYFEEKMTVNKLCFVLKTFVAEGFNITQGYVIVSLLYKRKTGSNPAGEQGALLKDSRPQLHLNNRSQLKNVYPLNIKIIVIFIYSNVIA